MTPQNDGLAERAMRDRAFVEAVSLLAALEALPSPGRTNVLPYLGIARAELVDYGQRQVPGFVQVRVTDLTDGLAELDMRLDALLRASEDLQHSLRIESALRWARRATGHRRDIG